MEQTLEGKNVIWFRFVYPALLLISSASLLPLALTVLSVDRYITYSKALGMEPSSNEGKELSDLPQFYADMFGWEEKARDVATVFNTLSEDEKQVVQLFQRIMADVVPLIFLVSSMVCLNQLERTTIIGFGDPEIIPEMS